MNEPKHRIPLSCPTEIITEKQTYHIDNVYCEGGSSIIYNAHTVNNSEDLRHILIKEFYPYDLIDALERIDDKLVYVNDRKEKINDIKLASSEYKTLNKIVYDEDNNWDSDFLKSNDHFEANNTCYIVLETARGKTLKEYIARSEIRDNQQEKKRQLWICQIMEHLIYLEKKLVSKGYLHMDISPDNIFVSGLCPDEKNKPYLIDFNSALCIQNKDLLTTDQASIKKYYTAPEIQEISALCNDDAFQKAANPHADIYSLTAVFFTLLDGSEPCGPIVGDVYCTDGDDSEINQVNQKINAFLKNGMNEDPDQRFDENPMKALDTMYEDIIEVIGLQDPKVQAEIKKSREAQRESKRDVKKIIIGAVLMVILLVVTIPYIINPYKDYDVYFRNDGETEWVSDERFQSPVVGSTIECKVCQKGLPSNKNVSIRLVLDDALKYDSFHSVTISPGDQDENEGTSIRSDIFSESYRVDDFIQNGKVSFYFDAIVLEEKDAYSVKTVVEDEALTETNATGSWWDSSEEGRPSYTIAEINNGVLGDTIVLNSISDSVIGDEKNFVGAIKNTKNRNSEYIKNNGEGNEIEAENGQSYIVRLYVHNNSPYPDHVAKDVQVKFTTSEESAKKLSDNDYAQKVWGWISSSNTSPSEYADSVSFYSKHPFHLEYQKGSVLLENNGIGANGGHQLNDSIWGNWTTIGYEQLDGNIPGCYQYDAYVGIEVKVVFDDTYEDTHKNPVFASYLKLKSQVSDSWVEKQYNAYCTEMLTCKINVTTTYKDKLKYYVQIYLPNEFKYVEGSTKLKNSVTSGEYVTIDDTSTHNICYDGLGIGYYSYPSNALLSFNILPQMGIEEGTSYRIMLKVTAYNDDIYVMERQIIDVIYLPGSTTQEHVEALKPTLIK